MEDQTTKRMINSWWSKSPQPLSQEWEEWLEKSQVDPTPFWDSIFAFHQKINRYPLQSSLGKHYDFYHDCISRHLQSHDVAYTQYRKDQIEHWTYKQLHSCVNYQVRKWSQHNPKPGQLAALIVSPGIEFVIALLTALRFGLTFCFLPLHTDVLGKKQIEKIVSSLSPQWIVKEQSEGPLNSEISHLDIDIKGQDDVHHKPHFYAYKAEQIIQTTLAVYRQEPLAFVSLDAHTLYLHAVRDYLFALNLPEHPSWAAPLSCPIRMEPCSTLMTLLAGTRMVHVPDTLIKENPLILKSEKIHLLGISTPLQQLWIRIPGAPRSVDGFFKMPYDMNLQSWKAFLQLNKQEKTACFRLLIDNSLGGVALLSRPLPDVWDIFLKSSPGVFCSLKNPEGSKANALPGYGVFAPKLGLDDNDKKVSNLTLSQIDRSCMFTGFILPCRSGMTFPISALEEIVNGLSFVEDCLLLPLSSASQQMDSHMALLVFISPTGQNSIQKEKDEWTQEIVRSIEDQLGREFIPDQIEYYPLIPKRNSGKIDRTWCANQYLSGLLNQKMERNVYQILHGMKKLTKGLVCRI